MAPVPYIARPTLSAVKDFVRAYNGMVSLYTPQLNVIAASPQANAAFAAMFGRDFEGICLLDYLGQDIKQLIENHGGWDRMLANGLSSIATSMVVDKGTHGLAADVPVKVAYTVLRMENGERFHIGYTTMLGAAEPFKPKVTFGEELFLEE